MRAAFFQFLKRSFWGSKQKYMLDMARSTNYFVHVLILQISPSSPPKENVTQTIKETKTSDVALDDNKQTWVLQGNTKVLKIIFHVKISKKMSITEIESNHDDYPGQGNIF